MDVKTIRRVRLTWLRDTRFGGVAAKLARAIDKSEAQVNRWLSGHRKISEDSAAHIESRLRQDPGSMGREPPATDIKHAIGLLIASWKAADPARHTDPAPTACVSATGSQRRTSTEPAASGLFLARVKII